MAKIHKHRWEYHPTSQMIRECIDCGLKQKKVKGIWIPMNWTVTKDVEDGHS